LVAACVWAVDRAAPATRSFPAAMARAASAGAAADPLYHGKLLGALDVQVKAISAMGSPAQVSAYLNAAAGASDEAGKRRLAQAVESGALTPEAAAALLTGSGLHHTDWLADALDELEDVRSGLGKGARRVFMDADGGGDRRLIEALRAAASRLPRGTLSGYGDELALAAMFDKATRHAEHAAAAENAVLALGARAHPSDLERRGQAGLRFKTPEGMLKTLSPPEVEAKFGVHLVSVMPKTAPEDMGQSHALYRAMELRSRGDRPSRMPQYAPSLDAGRGADLYVAKVDEKVGFGLFADGKIKDGQLIAEYTGALRVNLSSAEQRRNGYLFRLPGSGNSWFIDAERDGNYARFANHSTKRPNAHVIYGYHNGYYHVLLVAGRDIAQDEQILYDYGEDYWLMRDKPENL
jgi:hypothetical protein